MRWQIHALIRAALDPVPLALRRRLQDIRGRSRLDIGTDYPRKLEFIRRIQAQGLPIENRSFLEIGTGWHPVLPLLLSLCGAERVVGTDLNPWLNRRSLAETLHGLSGLAERIAEDLGISGEEVRSRLDEWTVMCNDPAVPLVQVLGAARLSYEAPVDAAHSPYPDHTFDYIISSNVFEHVPPAVIEAILEESKRILKPSGMHLHHVNPGDHFAIIDPRISSVNFLKFSPGAWRLIGGWGVGYHNRLRCVEYARMLTASGFEVTYEQSQPDARGLEALSAGKVRPHACFSGYSTEELAGHVVDVFARRANGSARAAPRE